ncbi:dk activating kinase (CAK)/RNA polymerase II, partial [Pseudoloma neurophilia]
KNCDDSKNRDISRTSDDSNVFDDNSNAFDENSKNCDASRTSDDSNVFDENSKNCDDLNVFDISKNVPKANPSEDEPVNKRPRYTENNKSEKLNLPLTTDVITRWYRPPELFLGVKLYSSVVDIWSVACVHFELITRCVLFFAENDIQMVENIKKVTGWTVDLSNFGDTNSENLNKDFNKEIKRETRTLPVLRQMLSSTNLETIDLLERMLVPDPLKRIGAYNALKHNYFKGVKADLKPLIEELEKMGMLRD